MRFVFQLETRGFIYPSISLRYSMATGYSSSDNRRSAAEGGMRAGDKPADSNCI